MDTTQSKKGLTLLILLLLTATSTAYLLNYAKPVRQPVVPYLRHQGNFSSNLRPTTTTTTTIQPYYDFYKTPCTKDTDCTIISAGCCPIGLSGGKALAILRKYAPVYTLRKRCPLSIKCGNMLTPTWYHAACTNSTCTKTAN